MRPRIVVAIVIALGLSMASWSHVVATLHAATCTGATPCNACKNCSSCKHCAKEGGLCGVCQRR